MTRRVDRFMRWVGRRGGNRRPSRNQAAGSALADRESGGVQRRVGLARAVGPAIRFGARFEARSPRGVGLTLQKGQSAPAAQPGANHRRAGGAPRCTARRASGPPPAGVRGRSSPTRTPPARDPPSGLASPPVRRRKKRKRSRKCLRLTDVGNGRTMLERGVAQYSLRLWAHPSSCSTCASAEIHEELIDSRALAMRG
jgi:hypothetical protein